MSMKTIIAAFVLMTATLLGPCRGVSALEMNDFDHGVRLITPARPALVKLVLPKRLYRDLQAPEGGDMRVFTLDGRMVPHLLRRPAGDAERPHELFFRTEANEAYVLAFGSRKAEALPPSPDLVRRAASAGPRTPVVRLGPRIVLGGSPESSRAPSVASSGRMVSLSTLLLGGILLLALLAWWTVRRRFR